MVARYFIVWLYHNLTTACFISVCFPPSIERGKEKVFILCSGPCALHNHIKCKWAACHGPWQELFVTQHSMWFRTWKNVWRSWKEVRKDQPKIQSKIVAFFYYCFEQHCASIACKKAIHCSLLHNLQRAYSLRKQHIHRSFSLTSSWVAKSRICSALWGILCSTDLMLSLISQSIPSQKPQCLHLTKVCFFHGKETCLSV